MVAHHSLAARNLALPAIETATFWLSHNDPLKLATRFADTEGDSIHALGKRLLMVEFSPDVESWVTEVLVWIGYGTVVGLLAKAVMPGRDPGGALATLAMGITGVIIGCGVWSLFGKVERVTPISGLVPGTLGAFLILLFYRILGGYWYEEPVRPRRRVRRRGTRRRYRTVDDY